MLKALNIHIVRWNLGQKTLWEEDTIQNYLPIKPLQSTDDWYQCVYIVWRFSLYTMHNSMTSSEHTLHSYHVINKLVNGVLSLQNTSSVCIHICTCKVCPHDLRNLLINLAMNVIWLQFFHHSAALHEAVLLVFVPFQYDAYFPSYKNCHISPIVIYMYSTLQRKKTGL